MNLDIEYEVELDEEQFYEDPRYGGVLRVTLDVGIDPPMAGSYSYNAPSDIDYYGHGTTAEEWRVKLVYDFQAKTWRDPLEWERSLVMTVLENDSMKEHLDELADAAFRRYERDEREAAYGF